MRKQLRKKGVQGKRVRIEPENSQASLLTIDGLIQRGKVVGAGTESKFKVGDNIIVSDWLVERIKINDDVYFYVPDEAVLDVL